METIQEQDKAVIYLKHMVCPRCIYVVKTELEKLNLPVQEVRLGEAKLHRRLSEEESAAVKTTLESFGFELTCNLKDRLVEKVKTVVLEMVRNNKLPVQVKFSEHLARETGKDYSALSHLFSASEKTTIEKYLIRQKIEYVKELLTYNELSLSQIACQLSYRDVGYLSRQFKLVTGKTPTQYKRGKAARKALDVLT